MISCDRVVRWLSSRLEGVSEGYQQDVSLTARELVAGADIWTRWLEVAALLALALRLRSRNRTDGRASVVWRQGLYLGALLLLVALATSAWSRLADLMVLAGTPTITTSLVGAIGLSAAIGLGLRGHRTAAVLLAASGAAACLSTSGQGTVQAMFASASVIAVGGLLTGTVPALPADRGRAAIAGALALMALPIGLLAGSNGTASGTTLAFTVVVPVGMVVAGWFDPRLAAAATVLVLSRLLGGGFDELGRALALLAQQGEGALLFRWILMSSGVLVAWFATHRSIRRLTRL